MRENNNIKTFIKIKFYLKKPVCQKIVTYLYTPTFKKFCIRSNTTELNIGSMLSYLGNPYAYTATTRYGFLVHLM